MDATMHMVTVFSDYICPFCFIGKERIESLARELPIQPVWKGFEIHPEVPPEGIPISRFLPEMVTTLEANVRRLAGEVGLEMRLPEKLSNSHLALVGGEIAREAGKLSDYHEAVFRAYFQEGKDIGDMDELVKIGESVGLAEGSFRESLTQGKYERMLQMSHDQVHALGITAVPSFVFPDGSVVVGVQSHETMKAVAERALGKKDIDSSDGGADGGACG